jgi:alpha-acetolactate decarboxylase
MNPYATAFKYHRAKALTEFYSHEARHYFIQGNLTVSENNRKQAVKWNGIVKRMSKRMTVDQQIEANNLMASEDGTSYPTC